MSVTAMVQTMCPRCGIVRTDATRARCGIDAGGRALCGLDCPSCSLPIFVRTTAKVAEAIFWFGGRGDPRLPLELLEPRSGPPLSWDEALDLHLALTGTMTHEEGKR